MVERDGRDEMVEDVGLDDAVHYVPANEAKFSVNGRSGATGKVPDIVLVVGKLGISVLQVGDGNYSRCELCFVYIHKDLPSQ